MPLCQAKLDNSQNEPCPKLAQGSSATHAEMNMPSLNHVQPATGTQCCTVVWPSKVMSMQHCSGTCFLANHFPAGGKRQILPGQSMTNVAVSQTGQIGIRTSAQMDASRALVLDLG